MLFDWHYSHNIENKTRLKNAKGGQSKHYFDRP